MANNLLTPTAVTREALRILHQKLNFIGSIVREYDDSFAKSGAKIGDSLKIRLPNQYTVRTGAVIDTQDTSETSVTLQVATQKGVDLNFTSVDLTLSLDDFSKRILEPAMSVLAANIEADAMSMYKDVYQSVWNTGSAATLAKVLQGRKRLNDSLAPNSDRTANLNTQDTVDLIDGLKTLFHDSKEIARQYREGFMGRAAGFNFVENTMWPSHTNGGEDGSYVVNTSTGIVSGTATIAVTGGAGTLNKGDVFTVEGVYEVHHETKQRMPNLQQFVVTEDYVGGAGSVSVSPTPITSGAKQNIEIVGAGASKDVVVEGTASDVIGTSLLYQKEAFAFATADLVMPSGVDFARREVLDGISMRIVRQYDINNDKFPCRLDVLYGYKTLRPQLACRLHNN
jgi:hypothetical protein